MSDRKGTVLAVVLIAGAALAAYHATFSAPFVFDDALIVGHNPSIRHLATALRPPHNGSTVEGRPLVNLSLAINYAISGTRVWSYHVLNLAIHIFSGLALFGIVRRTVRDGSAHADALAFAVALIWTVHPLQTEAVSYIAQRAESLMGLFYLLTLYGFIRGAEVGRLFPKEPDRDRREDSARLARDNQPYRNEPRRSEEPAGPANQDAAASWVWLLFSVGACLLGMATKEVMISAPLMVFLYDRTFASGSFREAWRRRRGFYLALGATWIPLACLVIGTANRSGTAGFGTNIRWSDYALTQVYAVPHYLRLALWPSPLVFDYGKATVWRPEALILPAALLLALLAGTLAGLCSHSSARRSVGFLGACFFAILAPTCLIPVATQTIAEHRMYLPLAAVLMVLALVLERAAVRPVALAALAGLAAAGLGAATAARNTAYRSELALWSDTVAKAPDNDRAHNNLGNALFVLGRIPEALEQYERALRLHPLDNADAQYNLGNCYLQEGRLPEAIEHGAEAVRLAPANPEAHNNLGMALERTGRSQEAGVQFQEAIAQYQEVLRSDPEDPRMRNGAAIAHYNSGNLLAKAGRMPEAIAHYEKALQLKPDLPEAQLNLGNAWLEQGQTAEAIAHYRAALKLRPDYPQAQYVLDIAERRKARPEGSR